MNNIRERLIQLATVPIRIIYDEKEIHDVFIDWLIDQLKRRFTSDTRFRSIVLEEASRKGEFTILLREFEKIYALAIVGSSIPNMRLLDLEDIYRINTSPVSNCRVLELATLLPIIPVKLGDKWRLIPNLEEVVTYYLRKRFDLWTERCNLCFAYTAIKDRVDVHEVTFRGKTLGYVLLDVNHARDRLYTSENIELRKSNSIELTHFTIFKLDDLDKVQDVLLDKLARLHLSTHYQVNRLIDVVRLLLKLPGTVEWCINKKEITLTYRVGTYYTSIQIDVKRLNSYIMITSGVDIVSVFWNKYPHIHALKLVPCLVYGLEWVEEYVKVVNLIENMLARYCKKLTLHVRLLPEEIHDLPLSADKNITILLAPRVKAPIDKLLSKVANLPYKDIIILVDREGKSKILYYNENDRSIYMLDNGLERRLDLGMVPEIELVED